MWDVEIKTCSISELELKEKTKVLEVSNADHISEKYEDTTYHPWLNLEREKISYLHHVF